MNPLGRMLLGSGRLPDALRAELPASGDVLLLEEGLRGSITYRHYRAPGRRSSWAKEAIAGAIAVTAGRVVVWAGRGKQVDVPRPSPYLAALEVTVEGQDRLCVAFDAGRFNADRAGRVEIRLRTPQAAPIAALLSG
jgi:hypothetical protein